MAKITDPSKLLPSTKSTAITKIGKGSFISPIKISKKTTSIAKGLIGEGSDKDTTEVNNKLLKVEKFLKSDLITSKKKAETRRKEKEREDFKKEEEKLEAPKEAKKFNLPGLNVPGMSFLDRIKRFLFFTALGWLFTKFQDQLPKLEGIVKTIGQVYGVAEGIFKSLLNGLVNFIDIGYQTYDGLRKKVEDLGGKDAAKTFDKFSKNLNELINGAIIAATLIASTDPKILKTPKQSKGPSGAGAGAAAAGGGRGRPGAGFTDPGRYRASGQARAGGFELEQARKNLPKKPVGPKGPLDRIGRGFKGAAAQLETGTLFKKGAGLQKALYNAPGKLKGLVPKGGGGALSRGAAAVRLPVVGPLVTFIVRRYVYGEKPSRAAAAAVGTAIGEMIGMFGGAAIAGGGTFFTGGLGAVAAPFVIGGLRLAGALAGEWIATKLYDFVTGAEVPKPQLKAAGGSVSNSGRRQRPATRSIRITRNKRPPKVKPQVSQPGKNVGGKKKIRELYPDPSVKTEIEGTQKGGWYDLLPDDKNKRDAKLKKLPNPYKALTNTAKILKDIPFGIGALMGGAVDIALGQKLPEDAIRGLGNGITYLINSIASRQMSASISNLQKEIVKMQAGGPVPRLRDFTREDSMNTDEGLTKSLNNLIQQKVDQAIKEVQKQMMPGRLSGGKKKTGDSVTPGIPGAPGGTPSGDAGDFSGNTKANKAFNYFKSQGYTDFQSAAIVGNLLQENRAMDPALTNSIGMKGIAQWDKNRWSNLEKFAKKKGLSPTDFETQLQFIQEELRTGDGGLSAKTFKSTKNLEQATVLFRKQYERPGEAEANDEARIKYARSVFSGSTDTKSGSQQFTGGVLPSTKLGSVAGMRRHPITGQWKEHAGNDYPMSAGTPISLLKGGEITRSEINGSLTSGYGNLIEIRHPDGSKSVYAHLAERRVNVGDKVNPGTIIGTVGSTGGSTGAHLHFEYDNADGSREKNASSLNSRADQIFRFGEVKPSQVYKLAMKDGKEGIIENGVWKPKKWTAEEKQKYNNIPSDIFKAPTKPQPAGIFDWNKKQGGGYVPKQSPNRKVSALNSYPSYSDGGMMIAIQPIIIEKTVPVPMRSSRGISFPVAGVNNSMGNSSSLNQG